MAKFFITWQFSVHSSHFRIDHALMYSLEEAVHEGCSVHENILRYLLHIFLERFFFQLKIVVNLYQSKYPYTYIKSIVL